MLFRSPFEGPQRLGRDDLEVVVGGPFGSLGTSTSMSSSLMSETRWPRSSEMRSGRRRLRQLLRGSRRAWGILFCRRSIDHPLLSRFRWSRCPRCRRGCRCRIRTWKVMRTRRFDLVVACLKVVGGGLRCKLLNVCLELRDANM